MNHHVIICEVPWSYVVFQHGDGLYLTFLSGGAAQTDHSIQLSESEVFAIKANSLVAAELVRCLNSDHEALRARELPSAVWPQKA